MTGHLGLIGFGEAGRVLAPLLTAAGADLLLYDRAFADPDRGEALRAAVASVGARAASTVDELGRCDVVLSLVTPATAVAAAASFAPSAKDDVMYVDLNSTAPQDKREVARQLPGARVVDGVMTGGGIRLDGARIPISLAGPDADEAAALLVGLGLNATVVGTEIGAAAGLKMLRSVVIKGMEALWVEALLAAEALDVVEPLFAMVEETLDRWPTRDFAAMLVTTHVAHAGRRRVEVAMVRDTVAAAGVEPVMSSAAVTRMERTASGSAQLGWPAGDVPSTLAEALQLLGRMSESADGSQRPAEPA